jgi:hypothetical protein
MISIRRGQAKSRSPEENIVRRQPKRMPLHLFFGSIALATTCLACTHNLQPVRASMQPLPPLSGRLRIATTIVPRSQKFKVAVLSFIDQTGRAQLVVDPIADMLTTELFAVKRFELYDRKDLIEQTHARELSENLNPAPVMNNTPDDKWTELEIQRTRNREAVDRKTLIQYQNVGRGKVDGVLLGYITSFKISESDGPQTETRRATAAGPASSDRSRPKKDAAKTDASPTPPTTSGALTEGSGSFDIDYRIFNTLAGPAGNAGDVATPNQGLLGMSELVVFGDSAKVRFHMTGGNIELDRQDVSRIADEIKKKFPEFSKQPIKVTSLQDRVISLNVGEQDGVKQGFTGYVIEKDDNTKVYRYLAEFVIINVFPAAATAVVVSESPETLADNLANIKVGSEAVIK